MAAAGVFLAQLCGKAARQQPVRAADFCRQALDKLKAMVGMYLLTVEINCLARSTLFSICV